MSNVQLLAQSCQQLADLYIEDTNLISATVVPPNEGLPEYCRILGYVRPAINFEIRLPTKNWNGKFYMAGCGAFCGKLESENSRTFNAINHGLRRNYAVSTTDGGHWGESLFSGRWAYHNPQAEIDFGYRAVHETARVTKVIIENFYQQPPGYSYFDGCSNGGRQAVMSALRYPEDFDGIISRDPAIEITKGLMSHIWQAQINTGSDGHNILRSSEVDLLTKAVYEACDEADGLKDGLISNPEACDFDPSTLRCDNIDETNCLSQAQVEVVQALYQGPIDSNGQQLYPGLSYGSEPFWAAWIMGQTESPEDDLLPIAGLEFMRYMAFRKDAGEQYSFSDFDFDKDPERLEYKSDIFDAGNPDLGSFQDYGGKLLMVQSLSDATSASPDVAKSYFKAVSQKTGSPDLTKDFFRLFLIPGMDHCGINRGPGITDSGFDPLTALERWIEHEEAPVSLLTTKNDEEGKIIWTRPVCPWPKREVYVGDGDIHDAANFECVDP